MTPAGSVVVLSGGSLSSVTVRANGGAGGSDNLLVTAPHGPGGGGSAGVVFASAPLYPASQAQPGAAGLTGTSNGPEPFGAGPGTRFSPGWRTDVAADELPIPAACRPIPLPITITQFSAAAQGLDAALSWTTAQEINNARFEVERSADGRQFGSVGGLPGAGTSTTPRSYRYLDHSAGRAASLLYYRLRQTDTDGRFSFSPIRTVRFAPAAEPLLTPNPADQTVVIDLAALQGAPGTVTFTDLLGRRVFSQPVSGQPSLTLPIRHWPAGVYVCHVRSARLRRTQQFVKQ